MCALLNLRKSVYGLSENGFTFLMKINNSAFLFEIIFPKIITAQLYKFVRERERERERKRERFQFKIKKILKSAFSNKHLKLI